MGKPIKTTMSGFPNSTQVLIEYKKSESDSQVKSYFTGTLIGQRIIVTSRNFLEGPNIVGDHKLMIPVNGSYSQPVKVPIKSSQFRHFSFLPDSTDNSRLSCIILEKPINCYNPDYSIALLSDEIVSLNTPVNQFGYSEDSRVFSLYKSGTIVSKFIDDKPEISMTALKYNYGGGTFNAQGMLLGLLFKYVSEESTQIVILTENNVNANRWIKSTIAENTTDGVYTLNDDMFYFKNEVLLKNIDVVIDGRQYHAGSNGIVEGTSKIRNDEEYIDSMIIEKAKHLLESPDVSVDYDTRTEDLETFTEFDLPDVVLDMPKITEYSKESESVSGSYSKEKDQFPEYNNSVKPEVERPKSKYESLVPKMRFIDYLDKPVVADVMSHLFRKLTEIDPRYGLMVEEVRTQKDLLQFLANFRWRRFNLLDRYVTFTEYASLTSEILTNVLVPTDFPVLITGNTVLKKKSKFNTNLPFSVDSVSNAIVYTDKNGRAKMNAELGVAYSNSKNLVNMSCYWYDADWLITNQGHILQFLSVNDILRKYEFKYEIMQVTGVRYLKEHMIVYIIANYTEHALTFDKEFNLLEDVTTEILPSEIVNLIDPKNVIFRDKYQYYINGDDGTIMTFPLIDMYDVNNTIVKKYTILKTTLVDPRPIPIVDDGPRINTKYGSQYMMTWSYNDSISLLTLLPAMGYDFDKYSFYNPRKYLKDADYNEACIPLHGGFRRTRINPWFWGHPGFTWVDGFYYGYGNYWGRYFSYWNLFWWFYW